MMLAKLIQLKVVQQAGGRHLAVLRAVYESCDHRREAQLQELSNVLLSSNKAATTGWAAKSGRTYDILLDDYGPGDWSLACNWGRIGPGTIGWIVRSDGSWGHLAGLLAIDRNPWQVLEPGGAVWYGAGLIFPLPREWWVDGARLNRDGWMGRPFGLSSQGKRLARFRSGEKLSVQHLGLLEGRLHDVAKLWIENQRARFSP